MGSLKLVIVFAIALIVIGSANASPSLARLPRSPKDGRVDLSYNQGKSTGRQASVEYNHNLYRSKNGRATVDAYGQASRNFDHNRNDYSAGIRGSIRF